MRKLKKLVRDFYKAKSNVRNKIKFAQVTLDFFEDVKTDLDNGSITWGENLAHNYPIDNVLEVFDAENFPDDYEYLCKLSELLEALEKD